MFGIPYLNDGLLIRDNNSWSPITRNGRRVRKSNPSRLNADDRRNSLQPLPIEILLKSKLNEMSQTVATFHVDQ